MNPIISMSIFFNGNNCYMAIIRADHGCTIHTIESTNNLSNRMHKLQKKYDKKCRIMRGSSLGYVIE
jgi:hypothetical protein